LNRSRIKRLLKGLYYFLLCILLAPRKRGLDPYKDAPLKYWIAQRVPGNKNSAVCLLITGKVSGVGYRNWLRRRARIRGLDYIVRRRDKRTIIALLIGSPTEIEALAHITWRGPSRSRVEKVRELWFNKPVKIKSDEGKGEETVAWSRGTASLIRRVLVQLHSIMQHPNEYTETERVSGTDEMMKAAEERNLFTLRCLRKEMYVTSPVKTMGLQRTKTTRVPIMIYTLTDHKDLAKKFLSSSGLPVPRGGLFEDLDAAKEYLARSNGPLVVKPAVGLNGAGVTVDIRTESALEAAWNHAKQFHDTIVMEELVEGVDIRVILIGGKAKAAYIRVPANVVGDGINTVEQLMDQKNRLRLKHPHLSKNLIVPDDYSDSYLSRQGHSFDSVPPAGEIVFLHLKANISRGGDSVNITDYLHPDLMRLAEEAGAVFGDVDYWGIDLLVERIDLPRDKQKAVIIELNSTANIEGVNYPFYGRRVNAAKDFIDYLFPEDTGDNSYPLDTVKARVTGILSPAFAEQIGELAGALDLDGSLRAGDSAAEITLLGRQHRILALLDRVWHWQKKNHLVDGLQICSHSEKVEKGFAVEVTQPAETPLYCGPRDVLDLEQLDSNSYSLAGDHPDQNISLNKRLFFDEFKKRGYRPAELYEDLLEIRKGDATGVTGMYHSSLFSDRVCDRRYPAKKLLALKGLPVLRGSNFRCSRRRRALAYFRQLSRTSLVTRLLPGQYETYLVKDEEKLKYIWKSARKVGTSQISIEEQIDGWNVLVAVVAGKAVGELIVEPLSLYGDGVFTVRELIKEKNRKRAQNPWYKEKPIAISSDLKRRLKLNDMDLDTVPGKGIKVPLESTVGFEYGGETANATGLLHDDFRGKAVEAVEAIPGLEFTVVQMLIPQPGQPASGQRWAIYSLDTKPDVAMFHYPGKGEPIDLAGRVVEDLCLAGRVRWMKER
jgi:D-alanine-D-alanine ligase-like ATP-grasp enzyme/acylphosphatase